MPEDLIRYEALVLDALRGVVRAVLQRVLKRGIPGDHHFFITFDTRAPGVGLSKRLKDQYPHEMTIVLQHQFWDLSVTEDRFEVRLSFNNVPERLIIPFGAVRIFQDPTVHFALALRPPEGDEAGKAGLPSDLALLPAPKADLGGVPGPGHGADEDGREASVSPHPENEDGPREERRTAEVVSLDKFRKK
ncbi:MAG: SspB family protein [Rhodomicrobium sp.]